MLTYIDKLRRMTVEQLEIFIEKEKAAIELAQRDLKTIEEALAEKEK